RHRRTAWAGFPKGASVTLERKLIRGDTVSRPQRKQIVLTTFDKNVPALSIVVDGELSPASRATLGSVPFTLPLREVRREPATVTVSGRMIPCEAVHFERMEPGTWR